jgi:hypothetical protein
MSRKKQLTLEECKRRTTVDPTKETEMCCICNYKTTNKLEMSRHVDDHFKTPKNYETMTQLTLGGRKLALLRLPESRFTLPNSEKFGAKLKYGTDVEKIILTTIAAHLKKPVVRQKEGSRFDYKVGGMGSNDHAESKSTSSLRESMLINKDKLKNKPPGHLWLVFSNLRGVWIMEYERDDFESKFGPARHEAGWMRLIFEVPVKYMTPIALFQ